MHTCGRGRRTQGCLSAVGATVRKSDQSRTRLHEKFYSTQECGDGGRGVGQKDGAGILGSPSLLLHLCCESEAELMWVVFPMGLPSACVTGSEGRGAVAGVWCCVPGVLRAGPGPGCMPQRPPCCALSPPVQGAPVHPHVLTLQSFRVKLNFFLPEQL